MIPLTASQIRAARAMLDWTREDLQKSANLSVKTIRNLEDGKVSPRDATNVTIREALEDAGLEFTDGGVRWAYEEVQMIRGANNCERLFSRMRKALADDKDAEIIAFVKAREVLPHLKSLDGAGRIKCLLSDGLIPLALPSCEFRTTSQYAFGLASCFVYGDKFASIQQSGHDRFIVIVYDIATAARDNRAYFLSLWESALPARVSAISQDMRTAA